MKGGHFDYARLDRKCHLCLYRIGTRVRPKELCPNTGTSPLAASSDVGPASSSFPFISFALVLRPLGNLLDADVYLICRVDLMHIILVGYQIEMTLYDDTAIL